MIILKSSAKNFPCVLEHNKHALYGEMKHARSGDVLLLAEMRSPGPALVRHAMRFRKQHSGKADEAMAIWGEPRLVMVYGEGCQELDQPFDPQMERVTPISIRSYAQGGTFVYVDPKDADAFQQKGLLRPFLRPSNS